MKQQFFFETGSKEVRSATKLLRQSGYKIVTSSLGSQVTPVGRLKMTMITVINPNDNLPDIQDVHDVFKRHGL